jgi:ADP-ribosylglycohydrolase
VPHPIPILSSRASGALLGLAAGRALTLGGEADGGLALVAILAEELAAGRRDLRRVAERWIERWQADPRGVDSETAAALAHLARHDAPPSQAAGQGSDPLVRCVPVALAAFVSPRNLVSATYHLVALTHPEPLVAWSAVAVNVALAQFLQGKRDFVPDLLEALRNNEVPAELLAAVRRVPLPERAVADTASAVPGSALTDAEAALRLAYHEPLLERGLHGVASSPGSAGRAALAGALLGARDGAERVPAAWTDAVTALDLPALAARLVRADSVAA